MSKGLQIVVPLIALCQQASEGLLVQRTCNEAQWEDLFKPIPQVRAEHPGDNLFCHFHYHAWWFPESNDRDYVSQGQSARQEYTEYGDKGPWAALHLEGGMDLRAQIDLVVGKGTVYDDAYCHELGWTKGLGLNGSLMADPDAWDAVAVQECQRFKNMYQLNDDDFSVAMHIADNPMIGSHAICAGSEMTGCKRATKFEYIAHAYSKCLLGGMGPGGQGDVMEMAWCYSRACEDEHGVVRHGDHCPQDEFDSVARAYAQRAAI